MTISKKRISRKYSRKAPINENKKWTKTHEHQLLENLEQRISMNVDNFLVLSEEGDPTQIALAHQKAKNEFMKFGPQMHRIAEQMGGDLSVFVDDFLESIHSVLQGQGMLDDDQISHCLKTTARLKAELRN